MTTVDNPLTINNIKGRLVTQYIYDLYTKGYRANDPITYEDGSPISLGETVYWVALVDDPKQYSWRICILKPSLFENYLLVKREFRNIGSNFIYQVVVKKTAEYKFEESLAIKIAEEEDKEFIKILNGKIKRPKQLLAVSIW